MHDDPVPDWLTSAQAAWSGHHAALAACLARPGAPRLTEEQEALALGMARRLVLALAVPMPLLTPPDQLWARWESDGIPAAGALAPVLLARVEEYRWRRMLPSPVADVAAPLFAGLRAETLPIASVGTDAEVAAIPAVPGDDAAEAAYLALRIADGARRDALGMPLLPPAELRPALRRTLMLDLAAQDLALAGDGDGRAAELAAAIDAHCTGAPPPSIDTAARRYHAVMAERGQLGTAGGAAIARGDWLALVALLAAAQDSGFAATAAALLAASDDAIVAALARLEIDAGAAAPLLDALAEVPARLGAQGGRGQ